MIIKKLFNATSIPLLSRGLDAYALRQRAIADNVANVETYGYRRKVVEFEDKLRSVGGGGGALNTTHENHIARHAGRTGDLRPELTTDPNPSDINELNNVDIDREMTDLTQNQLQFEYAGQMTRLYFDVLKASIRGSQ